MSASSPPQCPTVRTCCLSGKVFSADKGLAKALGVNAAIVFQYIYYWIGQNRMNPRAWKEGHPWMYQTLAQLAESLEILTFKEVRNAITKLVEAGYLVKGSHNRTAFDRTVWYRLGMSAFHSQGEEMDWISQPRQISRGSHPSHDGPEPDSKRKYDMPVGANGVSLGANGFASGGQTIQIDKEIEKGDISSLCEPSPHEREAHDLAEEFFELLKARKPDMKLPSLSRTAKAFDLMLRRDGRSVEEVRGVMQWATQDSFWGDNILSGEKLRKQFDQLALKRSSSAKARAAEQNRCVALDAQKRGAPVEVVGHWVRHTKYKCKELHLRMDAEAFRTAFAAFMGDAALQGQGQGNDLENVEANLEALKEAVSACPAVFRGAERHGNTYRGGFGTLDLTQPPEKFLVLLNGVVTQNKP